MHQKNLREGELNRTQAVIAHLIENEARGELILVDKAKALIELEQDFRKNLNDCCIFLMHQKNLRLVNGSH
jgi:hypothetical protein